MNVSRELAFFGGWTRRVVAGGTIVWGSPHDRVQEFAPSVLTNLLLPPDSPWLARGVPYWVVNTGSATLVVKRPSDSATVWALTAGSCAMFILGGGDGWYARPMVSPAQFGSVMPNLRYTVEISASAANVNLLQLVVALGYDGAQPAVVTCRVRTGVAIGTTHQGNRSLTSGNTFGVVSWASGSFWRLVVDQDAAVAGWGGKGGRGGVPGTGASTGIVGQNGGQAIRTEIPMKVDCAGLIFGGGAGGGGGGSSSTLLTVIGGGGGGGRGHNMASNGALLGSAAGGATAPANPGTGGGAFSFGAGGIGVGGGGSGGTAGGAAANGSGGTSASGGAGGGAGGTAGAAISYLPAAGAPVVLSGSSNILGSTVSEAV